MSKFSRQDVNRTLKNILPPSSPEYHQPADLTNFVQLVQEILPRSWAVDQWANNLVQSAAGQLTVDTPVVPTGKYWWVQSAHLLKLSASTNVHAYGLGPISPTNIINTVVLYPPDNVAGNQWPVNYQGDVAWLDRPLIIPPGYRLRGFAGQNSAGEVLLQMQIEWQFLELNIGDPYPS